MQTDWEKKKREARRSASQATKAATPRALKALERRNRKRVIETLSRGLREQAQASLGQARKRLKKARRG